MIILDEQICIYILTYLIIINYYGLEEFVGEQTDFFHETDE
jgi:hypothetical protein